ncbi:KLTH0D12562p [Lachancea thermotolerans CBS 6340]|uniref:KLTH0D12562p n=1 Tax=Lachancea thermotolerans (strain ATCC 56472 / CBS 6340 / NRRL Y-8284) TaxID=559295 RepID=C5DF64_LACTC|nr:KLTH0D12562p [Lachancea thermotolerans CBS 6340]CAR22819.1 KLTH0D12562p [Lachancea thermotolerans CBS 6340]
MTQTHAKTHDADLLHRIPYPPSTIAPARKATRATRTQLNEPRATRRAPPAAKRPPHQSVSIAASPIASCQSAHFSKCRKWPATRLRLCFPEPLESEAPDLTATSISVIHQELPTFIGTQPGAHSSAL